MKSRKMLLEPGKAVDRSARRDDFKARRAAARLAKKNAPPIEDTRVREVWARQEARDRAAVRMQIQQRAVGRLRENDGGKAGAKVTAVKLRVSALRTEKTLMRAAPGTFEWQYGRNRQDSLFHAGSHLAQIWERAGIAVASSADFLRGTAAGYATGISSGRLAAIEKLSAFIEDVGRKASDRLIAYCVQGTTSTDIAKKENVPQRDIAAVLRQDLKACAEHFHFIGNRGNHD